jgi:hypothetical protein
MKLRLKIVVIVVAVTACVIGFFAPSNKPPGITLDGYQQLAVGMTRQQFNDLLGGPPRDEVGSLMYGTVHTSMGVPPGIHDQWMGPGICIDIWFDENGKVLHRSNTPSSHGPPPSMWDKVRSRLPW